MLASESENIGAPQVRAQLERILRSEPFHKKEKLVSFLTYVVESTLTGKSDRIKGYSIGVDALGYKPEDSSDATVRAHALRLRQALDAYYSGEGKADPIRIDLPKGQYVPVFSSGQTMRTRASVLAPTGHPWRAAIAALFGLLLVFGVALTRPAAREPSRVLTQLTFFSGATEAPAPSWDGRTIAYSSDRMGDGGKEIWLRRIGQPVDDVRLTNHPADDYDPDLSPDGKWVVFRSMRDGGGVYLVSASGGEARRLNSGFNPRFSPDGRRIAYSQIEHSGNAGVYVAPFEGGEPAKVSGPLLDASGPVWSPDGRRLLVRGLANSNGGRPAYDVWLLSTSPTVAPVLAGVAKALLPFGVGVDAGTAVGDWAGNRLLVTTVGRLFELTLDQSGQCVDPVRALNPGPGVFRPRYSANGLSIVFELRNDFTDIWGLQGDFNQGKLTGQRRQWTNDQTLGWAGVATSLSADGSKLAYQSGSLLPDSGAIQIALYDLKSGRRWPVSGRSRSNQFRPVLNPAGSHVAFGDREASSTSVQITELSPGVTRIVCSNCGEFRDWSADGTRMLVLREHALVEISAAGAAAERMVVEGAEYDPLEAVYSPDGKWIAMVAGVRGKTKLQGVILPSRGAPPAEWIPVAEELYNLALHWAPDGNLLYYFSRKDDYRCLWAQRLDPVTKRPVGAAIAVEHFHSPGLRVNGSGWASVSQNWIGVNLSRSSSNLFSISRAE